MRLLVANAHAKQAHSITRSLRPHAERIVATLAGRRPFGFWPTDAPAYSRLVDARYQVPDPEPDWLGGRIQPANTPLEEAFIARILEICAKENIDTIFPSVDAWVYVFSKNKALFERNHILVPVPDLDTVLTPLDKYQTICAAEEVGFPCPKTRLAESDDDVLRIAREVAPPWIIKLRFTTGRRGMAFVDDRDELVEKCRATRALHGVPLIQEYIPGHESQSLYLVLDRDKRAVAAVAASALRRNQLMGSACAAETVPLGPFAEKAVALARHTGWWGGLTVQYKLDPRDGQPKLMEINPRLGENLWYRTELGINVPLMCLQIARGETVEAIDSYPDCVFLRPLEDLILLPLERLSYRFRTQVLRRSITNPLTSEFSKELRFARYWDDYLGNRERRIDPYLRYAWKDPLPLMVWLSKLLASLLDGWLRQAGRRILSVAHKLSGRSSSVPTD